MEQKDCKKYIECEAAKEAVCKIIVPEWVHAAFKRCIDDVPAADVRPVVRGKWVEHTQILYDGKPGYSIECTACHEVFTEVDLREKPSKCNFCPNCGADMTEVVTT